MAVSPVVYVVDDDGSVRRSLSRLLRSAGYEVELLESAESFLACKKLDGASCLVLDLQMPGLNGLQLQEAMIANGTEIPIVFISGHGDIPVSVRAMKAGAIDFLPKPFEPEDLLAAIRRAMERSHLLQRRRRVRQRVLSRCQKLTAREKDVFGAVVTGLLNKQIAARLKISEKTVKVHRARVMEKMRARSLAELVRFSEQANGTKVQ